MTRPKPSEYPEYFLQYINLVQGENPIKSLEMQIFTMQSILSDVPEEKEDYTYEKGKWTLKEVVGHVIDTERVMAYRALAIARGDKTSLPPFEPEDYMKHSSFNKRTLYDLAHEFGQLRGSNISLFKSFDEAALDRIGMANNWKMSVRSLIFTIAGHNLHHLNVIRTKYL